MGTNCARTCCMRGYAELRESDESEVGQAPPPPINAAASPPAALYAKTTDFSNDCAQDGFTRITDEATCKDACIALGGKAESFRADNWEVSPACWMVTRQFNGYLHNCGFNLGALSPSNSRDSNNELCLTKDGVAAFPQPPQKVAAQSGRCAYKGDLKGYCWFWADDGYCNSGKFKSWMGTNCARTCCMRGYAELRVSDESEVGKKLGKVNKALRIALGEMLN